MNVKIYVFVEDFMKKFGTILVSLLLIASFVGCSTTVHFNAMVDGEPIEGAKVYVDGQLIGETPTTAKLSNAVWEDPSITIKADGYRQLNTGLKKEAKAGPIVGGILLLWPMFLWCYGPKANQNFELEPATSH